jgi:DNA repair exonuclease SbcCD ATPase subunit
MLGPKDDMMKTVFVMSLLALLIVPTTLPLVFAPTISPSDDQLPNPNDIKKLEKKTSEFADHLAKLDAHLMKLASINPGPPSNQKSLVKHLDTIAHQLEKIEIRLNQLQTNIPPGSPPTDPTLIANLQTIKTLADHIAGIASQWQQNQNDPAVIAALLSIIDNANAVSITANSMLQ